MEFIWNRRFLVLANRSNSSVRISSGVLPRIVFATQLFTKKIENIDKDIVKSIVRSFINDTRVNKQLSNVVDVRK